MFDRLWPRRRGTARGGQEDSDKMTADEEVAEKKGKGGKGNGKKLATKVKVQHGLI